jgi:hypothetical protein
MENVNGGDLMAKIRTQKTPFEESFILFVLLNLLHVI